MKLLRSFSVYTVASFINKGMMFAIIPFLTNVMSPEQNGVLSLFGVFVMLIIPFTLMGFANSIVIEYAKLNPKEYSIFFSSSLLLSTIAFFLLLLLFFIFGNHITALVGIPRKLLWWGILYAYGNVFFEGILAFLRTRNNSVTYFWLSIGKCFLELCLIIWLVIDAKGGAEGKILASLIGVTCIFIIAIIIFLKHGLLTTRVKKAYLKMELKFGISQIFFQLNLFVLACTDKVMIGHLLNDKAGLGIYFVANQFAYIINVFISAFFISFQPQLYAYLSNLTEANKYALVRIKYLFAGFLFVCTLLLCLATPLFYHLCIKNLLYHSGIAYVAWNAFAFFFWGLYTLFLEYLYFYGKNRVVILFSLFSSVLCVVMNYFFIKEYKIMGAAYADLVTYIILFVAIVITFRKVLKIDLPWFDFRRLFNLNYVFNV